MRFRILGPLEICGSDGETVALRAPKLRTLLVVLLLRPNAAVSAGRLETALWPDRPPRSAPGVIRTYASGLRAALSLGEGGRLPGLAKEPGGYRLALAPGDLDLDVFDDLSAQGRDALARGDAARAAQLLADALGLWRGEPGADVTLDCDSAAILADVAERRVRAEEAWAEARLLLGGGADLIDRLRILVTEQPLRERTCGQLMRALYRAGRKTEALEEFHALRGRLADELGIEPSALIQDLHQRILADQPALARAHKQQLVPRQLPGDIRDFTGRDVTLAAMKALVPDEAEAAPVIIAITGMAGVGKTALAVHFAHLAADCFPDGQLFVDLRGYAEAEPKSPTEALCGFLRALGVREIPDDTQEAAALYRSLLAGRQMVLVLDNAADAGQLRPLLPGSPGCLVLITSRSRLPGLLARDGARPVVAEPLTSAEGAALLRKILGPSRVQSDLAAAAAIVERCACLPLALRIAAERAAHRPQLPLAALAGELAGEQRRLDTLTITEDADTSVRSVFSWSYRRLAPDAARMFRMLALHPGPDIGIAAAAALAGCTVANAARPLRALADAHLLSEVAVGRYQLHDLLRAYAAERAAADEPLVSCTAALRRVLTWYLHTADASDDGPLAWCAAEYPDLMAAVRTAAAGEDTIPWKLPVVLACYLAICRRWAESVAAESVAAGSVAAGSVAAGSVAAGSIAVAGT
jgi:DNA-binding SARP family transcriptional activator